MKFGFTNNHATSSITSDNSGRTTRKLRKRSSSHVAKTAQKTALASSSSVSASSPVAAAISHSKFDVFGVNWKVLRTDHSMLREVAVSTFGSSVDTIVDTPELLLRSMLAECEKQELKYVCVMLDVEEIPNDKEALVAEIVNSFFGKEQRSNSTEQGLSSVAKEKCGDNL